MLQVAKRTITHMNTSRKPHWAEHGQFSASRDLRTRVARLLDLLILAIAFTVAHQLRFDHIFFTTSELIVALIFTGLFSWVASYAGLYTPGNLISSKGLTIIAYAYILSMAILAIGLLVTHYATAFSRIWFFVGSILGIGAIMFARGLLQASVKSGWLQFPTRKTVIIGAGAIAEELAKRLRQDPYKTNEIVGYFRHNQDFALGDVKELGNINSVEEVLEQFRSEGNPVDRIFVALPSDEVESKIKLIESLLEMQYSIFVVPDYSVKLLIDSRSDDVSGLPVIDVSNTQLQGTRATAKNVLDFFMAGFALLCLSPLFVAIAIAIKLDSKGPVFFTQRRYGMGGREISVHKFRTMSVMEDGAQVTQASVNDVRVTRVGRFLRSSSFDELPQLYNVVRGNMSLVGPRPHAVAHNELYRTLIGGYMSRHSVKPGITGLAQVNGCRGETSTVDEMQKRVDFDIKYLRTWSIWLDFQILLRTVAQMLRPQQRVY